jgi:transposase
VTLPNPELGVQGPLIPDIVALVLSRGHSLMDIMATDINKLTLHTFSRIMSPKPTARRGTMKPLALSHPELRRDALLSLAEAIPGAWAGIRIAAFLLMLTGWKSTQVAELFGLSRWGAVKLIQKANREGLDAIVDHPRPGRPPQIDEKVLAALDEALSKSPQDYGLSRNRWDGVVVAEYLKRSYSIKIHVRHAQRIIRKLGYTLRRPTYQYVQATDEGAAEFQEELRNSFTPEKARVDESCSLKMKRVSPSIRGPGGTQGAE